MDRQSHQRQRGQAAVYAYLFLAITVVSMLFLYKAGKLTSDKMQLQNAADAAAYSVSLVEARDLNFASYMNRAIVANEVAIGQLVGLASWAFHLTSIADYLDTYDKFVLSPATLGVSTGIITPITTGWRSLGNAVSSVLNPIANIGTSVIHNINKVYGAAEYGHHIVTAVFVIGTLDTMLRQNGPPGTKISDFGMIALIMHIYAYGSIPGLPGEQFSTFYSPSTQEPKADFDVGGYGRLAATIRESRDPFTYARGWELRPPGFPIDETFTFGPYDVIIGDAGMDVAIYMDISLERKGASELRVVVKNEDKVSGKNLNWSSADTTGLFFAFALDVDLWLDPLIGSKVSVGGSFSVRDSQLSGSLRILGIDICATPPFASDCGVPFPTSAPFASGFAQAGKKLTNDKNAALKSTDLNLASMGGNIETEHYGEAANNLAAWISPGPGPIPPQGIMVQPTMNDTRSRVNKSYAGLPHYVDTTGTESTLFGFGAPMMLVGLVLDEPDFDQNNAGATEPEPTGNLAITEQLADQELGALAKSEVYFKRPTDLHAVHFLRSDGNEEYGSAFNPFWNARLVETSYADRIIALLIQQKADWINIGGSINALLPGFPVIGGP